VCLSVANRHRIKADGRIELVFGTEAFFSPRALRYKKKVSLGGKPPYLSEHCIPVSSADTRRHLRSANRHLGLLAVPRFRLNTYGRRTFSVAGRWPGTHSRILSGIQRAAQTVLGVYLKRTCSRVTSVSSALRVLNDYALYKSTHSLTHPLQKIRGFCSELWTLKLRHDHRNMLST